MFKKVFVAFSILALIFSSCANDSKAQRSNQTPKPAVTEQAVTVPYNNYTNQDDPWKSINPTKVNKITTEQFKQLVFDYTKYQVWKYQGDKPCVIDFYADWCRPCRYVSPIMEQLAAEYKGQIYFYKVDVDRERELASVFGIRSIPSVLFCPVNGQPQMAIGAMPKERYIQAIEQVLGVKYPKN